jgi:hypothetical protein
LTPANRVAFGALSLFASCNALVSKGMAASERPRSAHAGIPNKNAFAVMPKNQWGWYNSVIADDFLVQNLETRIHMFLGGSPLFQIQSIRRSEIARSTVISQNGASRSFLRIHIDEKHVLSGITG